MSTLGCVCGQVGPGGGLISCAVGWSKEALYTEMALSLTEFTKHKACEGPGTETVARARNGAGC